MKISPSNSTARGQSPQQPKKRTTWKRKKDTVARRWDNPGHEACKGDVRMWTFFLVVLAVAIVVMYWSLNPRVRGAGLRISAWWQRQSWGLEPPKDRAKEDEES